MLQPHLVTQCPTSVFQSPYTTNATNSFVHVQCPTSVFQSSYPTSRFGFKIFIIISYGDFVFFYEFEFSDLTIVRFPLTCLIIYHIIDHNKYM